MLAYADVCLGMAQCPTIALSVVGETVEMCTTVKFLTDKRTIAAGEMGADMLVQVLRSLISALIAPEYRL